MASRYAVVKSIRMILTQSRRERGKGCDWRLLPTTPKIGAMHESHPSPRSLRLCVRIS